MRIQLRLVAGVLLAALFFQEVAFAYPEAKPLLGSVEQKPKLRFILPESVATLEDSWIADGDTNTGRRVAPVGPPHERAPEAGANAANRRQDPPTSVHVYLLQDAHTNESGQLNLAKTLDLILKNNPDIQYVFTEAGVGDNSLSFLYNQAPGTKLEQVSKTYLKKGLLHGAEYLQLTDNPNFTLWGVEDLKLYQESLNAYKAVAKQREDFEIYLSRMDSTIGALKEKLFNPVLFSFEKKYSDYLDQKIALSDYFQILLEQARIHEVDLKDLPNLSKIKTLRAKEGQIDFKKANAELTQALQSLSEKERHSIAKIGLDKKEERAYFALLEEQLNHRSAYHELQKYFDYLRISRSLDFKKILQEQKILEKTLFEKLALSEDEQTLLRCQAVLRYLQKLFRFTLTPEEFEEFNPSAPPLAGHLPFARGGRDRTIAGLTGFLNQKLMEQQTHYDKAIFLKEGFDDIVEVSEKFYSLTKERDEAFVRNMLAQLETGSRVAAVGVHEEGAESPMGGQPPTGPANRPVRAVLITGGYHTPSLKSLLKQKNISYFSLTPQVFQETNIPKYEKLLLNQSINQAPAIQFTGGANHLMLWQLLGTPWAKELAKDAAGISPGTRLVETSGRFDGREALGKVRQDGLNQLNVFFDSFKAFFDLRNLGNFFLDIRETFIDRTKRAFHFFQNNIKPMFWSWKLRGVGVFRHKRNLPNDPKGVNFISPIARVTEGARLAESKKTGPFINRRDTLKLLTLGAAGVVASRAQVPLSASSLAEALADVGAVRLTQPEELNRAVKFFELFGIWRSFLRRPGFPEVFQPNYESAIAPATWPVLRKLEIGYSGFYIRFYWPAFQYVLLHRPWKFFNRPPWKVPGLWHAFSDPVIVAYEGVPLITPKQSRKHEAHYDSVTGWGIYRIPQEEKAFLLATADGLFRISDVGLAANNVQHLFSIERLWPVLSNPSEASSPRSVVRAIAIRPKLGLPQPSRPTIGVTFDSHWESFTKGERLYLTGSYASLVNQEIGVALQPAGWPNEPTVLGRVSFINEHVLTVEIPKDIVGASELFIWLPNKPASANLAGVSIDSINVGMENAPPGARLAESVSSLPSSDVWETYHEERGRYGRILRAKKKTPSFENGYVPQVELFEGVGIASQISLMPKLFGKLGYRILENGHIEYPDAAELNGRLGEILLEKNRYAVFSFEETDHILDRDAYAFKVASGVIPIARTGKEHYHDLFIHAPGYAVAMPVLQEETLERSKAILSRFKNLYQVEGYSSAQHMLHLALQDMEDGSGQLLPVVRRGTLFNNSLDEIRINLLRFSLIHLDNFSAHERNIQNPFNSEREFITFVVRNNNANTSLLRNGFIQDVTITAAADRMVELLKEENQWSLKQGARMAVNPGKRKEVRGERNSSSLADVGARLAKESTGSPMPRRAFLLAGAAATLALKAQPTTESLLADLKVDSRRAAALEVLGEQLMTATDQALLSRIVKALEETKSRQVVPLLQKFLAATYGELFSRVGQPVRRDVVSALVEILKDESVPILLDAWRGMAIPWDLYSQTLNASDPIASAIMKMGRNPHATIERIYLEEKEPRIREILIRSYDRDYGEQETAVDLLLRFLVAERDKGVRNTLIDVLPQGGYVGSLVSGYRRSTALATRIIQALLYQVLLNPQDPLDSRGRAARSIASFASQGDVAVKNYSFTAMQFALNSLKTGLENDEKVRIQILVSMTSIFEAIQMTPILETIIRDEKESLRLREEAARGTSFLNPYPSARLISVFNDISKDGRESKLEIRKNLIRSFGRKRIIEMFETMKKIILDRTEHESMRKETVDALLASRSPEGKKTLEDLVKDLPQADPLRKVVEQGIEQMSVDAPATRAGLVLRGASAGARLAENPTRRNALFLPLALLASSLQGQANKIIIPEEAQKIDASNVDQVSFVKKFIRDLGNFVVDSEGFKIDADRIKAIAPDNEKTQLFIPKLFFSSDHVDGTGFRPRKWWQYLTLPAWPFMGRLRHGSLVGIEGTTATLHYGTGTSKPGGGLDEIPLLDIITGNFNPPGIKPYYSKEGFGIYLLGKVNPLIPDAQDTLLFATPGGVFKVRRISTQRQSGTSQFEFREFDLEEAPNELEKRIHSQYHNGARLAEEMPLKEFMSTLFPVPDKRILLLPGYPGDQNLLDLNLHRSISLPLEEKGVTLFSDESNRMRISWRKNESKNRLIITILKATPEGAILSLIYKNREAVMLVDASSQVIVDGKIQLKFIMSSSPGLKVVAPGKYSISKEEQTTGSPVTRVRRVGPGVEPILNPSLFQPGDGVWHSEHSKTDGRGTVIRWRTVDSATERFYRVIVQFENGQRRRVNPTKLTLIKKAAEVSNPDGVPEAGARLAKNLDNQVRIDFGSGSMVNVSLVSRQSLPTIFFGETVSRTLLNAGKTFFSVGGWIGTKIMPAVLEGGNFPESRKSLSWVNSTLSSSTSRLNNSPFFSPLGQGMTSYPDLLRGRTISKLTFSSANNLQPNLGKGIMFLVFQDLSGVMQSGMNVGFSKTRIAPQDLFPGFAGIEKLENDVHGNPRSGEAQLSVANVSLGGDEFLFHGNHGTSSILQNQAPVGNVGGARLAEVGQLMAELRNITTHPPALDPKYDFYNSAGGPGYDSPGQRLLKIAGADGPDAKAAINALLVVSQEKGHRVSVYFDILQALMVLADHAKDDLSKQALSGIQDFVRRQDPQTIEAVDQFKIMTTYGSIGMASAFDDFLSGNPSVDRSRHEDNIRGFVELGLDDQQSVEKLSFVLRHLARLSKIRTQFIEYLWSVIKKHYDNEELRAGAIAVVLANNPEFAISARRLNLFFSHSSDMQARDQKILRWTDSHFDGEFTLKELVSSGITLENLHSPGSRPTMDPDESVMTLRRALNRLHQAEFLMRNNSNPARYKVTDKGHQFLASGARLAAPTVGELAGLLNASKQIYREKRLLQNFYDIALLPGAFVSGSDTDLLSARFEATLSDSIDPVLSRPAAKEELDYLLREFQAAHSDYSISYVPGAPGENQIVLEFKKKVVSPGIEATTSVSVLLKDAKGQDEGHAYSLKLERLSGGGRILHVSRTTDRGDAFAPSGNQFNPLIPNEISSAVALSRIAPIAKEALQSRSDILQAVRGIDWKAGARLATFNSEELLSLIKNSKPSELDENIKGYTQNFFPYRTDQSGASMETDITLILKTLLSRQAVDLVLEKAATKEKRISEVFNFYWNVVRKLISDDLLSIHTDNELFDIFRDFTLMASDHPDEAVRKHANDFIWWLTGERQALLKRFTGDAEMQDRLFQAFIKDKENGSSLTRALNLFIREMLLTPGGPEKVKGWIPGIVERIKESESVVYTFNEDLFPHEGTILKLIQMAPDAFLDDDLLDALAKMADDPFWANSHEEYGSWYVLQTIAEQYAQRGRVFPVEIYSRFKGREAAMEEYREWTKKHVSRRSPETRETLYPDRMKDFIRRVSESPPPEDRRTLTAEERKEWLSVIQRILDLQFSSYISHARHGIENHPEYLLLPDYVQKYLERYVNRLRHDGKNNLADQVQVLINSGPVGARLSEVTFIARVYSATQETGRLVVDNSIFEVSEEGGFLVIHGYGKELLRTKDYQKIAKGDGQSFEIKFSMSDFQIALKNSYGVAESSDWSDVSVSTRAVSEIDVTGWDEMAIQMLVEELALAHERPWGRSAKFLLRSDKSLTLPPSQDFMVTSESELGDWISAKRILITNPNKPLTKSPRYFFMQSPRAGDYPNFRGAIRASLSLARIDELTSSNLQAGGLLRFVGLLLGHEITDLSQYIKVTENPGSLSEVERQLIESLYTLPHVIQIPVSQAIQGARLAIQMTRQAA